MSEELTMLKPCPFCGGEAKVQYRVLGYEVGCSTKRCPGNMRADYSTEEEATLTWNRRAALSREHAQPAQGEWVPMIGSMFFLLSGEIQELQARRISNIDLPDDIAVCRLTQ